MNPPNGDHADRAVLVRECFDRGVRECIRCLVTESVIAEHAARPLGPHSDALARVLTFLRRAPVEDKFVVVTIQPD